MPKKGLAAATALAGVVPLFLAASQAFADFKVWHPDAEFGETALETVGDWGYGSLSRKSDERSFTEEFERGVTPFWRTELELEEDRLPGPGNSTNFGQVASENVFQFTPRGEYWLDAGFFFEYGQSMLPKSASEITFGPVLRKEIFHTIDTVNLFIEKDLGAYAGGRSNFLYAWETRIDLGTSVEPGFQAYGAPGPVTRFAPLREEDHRLGPMLFGTVFALGPGTLVWNGGVLFGLTAAAPAVTLRWQAEYEIHF
jgi:hypothetical protein